MLRLCDFWESGSVYKVRLLFNQIRARAFRYSQARDAHVTSDGGFEMERNLHIQRWLDHIAPQPRYIDIIH
jgi:hypothetical protein